MNRRRILRWIPLAALFGALHPAAVAQLERGMIVTGFRVPQYDEEGRLKTQVFGDRARAVSEHVVDITNLRIETFNEDQVDMRVIASRCRYNQRTGVATSDEDVRITRSNVVISGTGFRWEAEPSRFEIHSNARVVIRGERPRSRTPGERRP